MSLSYDYYPAIMQVLHHIGEGRTLTDACDRVFISVPVFTNHVKQDAALQAMYEEAVQRGNDAMADALINIDNHAIHGQSDAKMAKVISDNIKWVLSKRDGKRFGEKIEVKHEITMDRAIVSALEAARTRVPVIDADYTRAIDVTPALPSYAEDDEVMRELLS